MSAVNPTATGVAASSEESWAADLGQPGAEGDAALARLHGVLLRACRHQVWRLRYQLPGAGAGELEDIAQQAADDALVAVLRRLNTFQGRSRFTTWVYKFGVLHAAVAVRRQAWRGREVPLPDDFSPRDAAPSVSDLSEAAQLARAVGRAIQTTLTPHQRRVAIALLLEGVPIDVLADRLGTSRNALYKTLHDARRRLRAALEADGYLVPVSDRSTP